MLITILGIVGTFIFTMPYFLPPYFKSEIIFYPPGTNSNRILLERDTRFGSDKELDEQIQILKSSIVRDSIISKFGLIAHYKIDTSELEWTYWFYKQLEDNISIERTRYNSISVKVYDTDPVVAARMANDMVVMGDAVKSAIIKTNLQTAYNSIEQEYFNKSKELDRVVKTMNGFIDHPISSRVVQHDKTYPEKLKEQLDIQKAIDKAREENRLSDMEALYNYQLSLQQLNEIQSSYFQAYTNLHSFIPTCYIITPAEISYRKAGPKRLLIILVAGFASLAVSMLLAIGSDKIRDISLKVTGSDT